MEYTMKEEQKSQYDSLLSSAKDIEVTIGAHQYRLYKFLEMRKEIDVAIRKWWEVVIADLGLDPKIDYMISNLGTIQSLENKNNTIAPKTIEELK